MSERTSKKPGIADSVAARRKHRDCFLDEIDRRIDWKPFEKVLRFKVMVINLKKLFSKRGTERGTSMGWQHPTMEGKVSSLTDYWHRNASNGAVRRTRRQPVEMLRQSLVF